MEAIDFHSIYFFISVGGYHQLVTNILQNIFYCVQQKKESHWSLEQLEGE